MKKLPWEEWNCVESMRSDRDEADKKKSFLNALSYAGSQSLELQYTMLDKAIKKSVHTDKRRIL